MSWFHSLGLSEKFNIVRMALEKGVYLQWEQPHQHGKGYAGDSGGEMARAEFL